ncbi:class II fructose-bisphosphate aldolase [Pleomorphochaeta sp. DL1XJH-081]|uniref:class II fructose-bisphosphate aldolase n=1 Tax=Pleomorphochaeta sp. DL1XJH-081 TaxID=3409690 RepID=UPI003BB55711
MPLTSAKEMLQKATIENYCVGAFNFTSFVQAKAIIKAAEEMNAPVILQTSVSPAKFYSPHMIVGAIKSLANNSTIPICLHLDHCTDVDFCLECADAGYTNIMYDGSSLDFDKNIENTKRVTEYCHSIGNISVEGELGTVMGVEDQIVVNEDDAALCPVDKVLEYVERSQVDLFAPAIGTAHGVYKTANPFIDLKRLKEIFTLLHKRDSIVPLVIHGGTGLQQSMVKQLIVNGGAKFNVSTELKHVLIDTTFNYLTGHPSEYNPGKLDKEVFNAHVEKISEWIGILGSGEKA